MSSNNFWIAGRFFNLVAVGRFCWGFCEKGVFERGFLMVGLWWIVVSWWLVDGVVSGGEKSDTVLRFIFVS
ncbi:hypothetical protein [Tunturiibacter gelidoferens]|uniref:Transmembrane protein n=1 Tax=Tunturiibacter lichenicola TaxID=2051959 RepID=A0A7Y9T2R4_9BACT|nr:hypothetical protein [Edaphobacter lichenicola]NYF51432.1 hypothetical protein [Edaphobacter lichenicola]